jgi:hypothetical protein
MEAGCKTVVANQVQPSVMFWSQAGATSIMQFRTLPLSQIIKPVGKARQIKAAANMSVLAFEVL